MPWASLSKLKDISVCKSLLALKHQLGLGFAGKVVTALSHLWVLLSDLFLEQ